MSTQLMDLSVQARRTGLWCDWRDGPGLGAVLVSGADGAGFLQAQLTSDVLALGPGTGQLSARLNRRGQLMAWFSLHRLPDRGQPYASFLLLLPSGGIAALVADLEAFVVSEDVVLEDISGEFGGLVWQQPMACETSDPLAAAVLGAAWPPALPLPEHGLLALEVPGVGELWLIRRALAGDPGLVLLQPGGVAESLRRLVAQAAGARGMVDLARADGTVWRCLETEAGWPVLGRDLESGQRTLPQTGLERHVVSFTKGCYLGQEVVARLRTYGSVPEALRAVVWRDLAFEDQTELPAAGTALRDAAGLRLGTWAGSAWAPTRQMTISLAFLNRAARTPGNAVSVEVPDGTASGDVALLPLYMGASASERATQLHDQALAHFSAGRDRTAVALLEESLRLDPTRAEVFEALGVILGRLQKYHEAIDIFRRLEEVAPEEPMVHTNLSLFYMQIGEKDEAERQKSLATLKKFGVTVDARQAEALAAQDLAARRAEAERKQAMFSEVLEIDPEDALALMGMGQALETLDDLEGAAAYLQQALAGQDNNSALFASCGRVLARLGRTSEAREVYRRGIGVASRRGDLMPLKEMEHRLQLLAD
jgi:folate-binding protein YgfZ